MKPENGAGGIENGVTTSISRFKQAQIIDKLLDGRCQVGGGARLRSHESSPSAWESMAGRQGLEPRYADPESAVLPLDDLPRAQTTLYQREESKGRYLDPGVSPRFQIITLLPQ